MTWVGLFLIAPMWGPVSTIMFYHGWLSFLGILACMVGLAGSGVSRRVVIAHLFNHVTRVLFFGLVLVVGFMLLFKVLPFGRTQGEMIVYWVTATITLVAIIPRISNKIDQIWKQVNGG